MACMGLIGGGNLGASSPSASWSKSKVKNQKKKRTGFSVNASYSSVRVSDDPYTTLRIHPGASESDVKKAFRQLALQYHPDVCRGNNCGIQFHQINEAYDMVMSQLREETTESSPENYCDQGIDEPMRGVNDEEYDLWEEWMGWEGAGIRDYTSHINPYI